MAYLTTGGATVSLFRAFPINSAHDTVSAVELTVEAVVKTSRSGTGVSVESIKSDTALWDFINEFASELEATGDTATEAETVLLDDESEVTYSGSGSSSTGQQFLCISTGGTNTEGIKTQIFIATLNGESGAHDQEGKKFDRPTLQFDGVEAVADVTVTTTELGATYGAAATATLLTGKWIMTDFLPAA